VVEVVAVGSVDDGGDECVAVLVEARRSAEPLLR
jgi:hypothetical protein